MLRSVPAPYVWASRDSRGRGLICGICGMLGFRGETAAKPHRWVMTAALARRGRDNEGIRLDGSAGLGHTRLPYDRFVR